MTTKLATSDHPLFRPGSLYRLATDDWLWFDGGETAIRRYFEGLRRQELHREWSTGVPEQVQDWGHTPEVNQAVHDALVRRAAEVPAEPGREPEAADAAGVVYAESPAAATSRLLRFDFSRPAPLESSEPEYVPDLFGESAPKLEADKLDLDLRIDGDGRDCLLLLLPKPLIEVLGWIVEQPVESVPALDQPPPEPWRNLAKRGKENPIPNQNNSAVARVLSGVFEAMIEPEEETEESLPQFRRSWWVSTTLAQAVGVAGTSQPSESGFGSRFRKTVQLERVSPTLASLADRVWAVLCLGGNDGSLEVEQ